ncbi:Outer membrane lipoprotein Blc [Pseudoalteromonas holothuriae]|uniref:Outer membrane lipoprotein Blc n=1 Tax=Pseudoalteromonas holothuriae TaxID=2963714 RepID=A0A9W4VU61_9GAMM|nr:MULTISPECIES: lipocalin family protein [unclassified Pseudoalteromonas]CAH9063758.1 Outer membrane lipoprotein Blc [Pseudoalteromonas sp. CIP111854]CAH9064660.1 Outer membrane lipoprotein Blc [Pseudoalteromonas sp. CIP111951]
MKHLTLLFSFITLLTACTGLPTNIKPVSNFELDQYKGKWYEIARLNHSFEKDLTNVTATYSLNSDGSIKVINRGYNTQDNQWQQANGTAKFVSSPNEGHLKVSFFGPFYGSYVVFKLDKEDYQYAYVTSYNKEYLWLLARTPTVEQSIIDDFVQTVQQYDYAVEQLIYVQHNDIQ